MGREGQEMEGVVGRARKSAREERHFVARSTRQQMIPLFLVLHRLGADDGNVGSDGHHDVGVVDRMSGSVAGMEGHEVAVPEWSTGEKA